MSEYQVSILTNSQNIINMLYGTIIKLKTKYISKNAGYLTQNLIQKKLESLTQCNKNVVYTFFTYKKKQFIRFATTETQNNVYALNTHLSKYSIAYTYLLNKEKFIGFENLFDYNTRCYCSYDPIIDNLTNALIGCFFIGVKDNTNTSSNLCQISNLTIKHDFDIFGFINDVLIMLNNIFGKMSLINNILISQKRGAILNPTNDDDNCNTNNVVYNNTNLMLSELLSQINYKNISVTIYKFINKNFIQICCSENTNNELIESDLAYKTLINKNEFNTIYIPNVCYYVSYIPILDPNTNNLIGAYYIKFGPFNMI